MRLVRPGYRRPVGVAILATLLAGAAAAGFFYGRSSRMDHAAEPSGRPSPLPTATPRPSPTPEIGVRFGEEAGGDRLSFRVIPWTGGARPCRLRFSQTSIGLRMGAFLFCGFGNTSVGLDLYLFNVSLANRARNAITVRLRNFAVVGCETGESHGPIDIRRKLEDVPGLFPPTALITPGASVSGWIAFDGRVGYQPDQMSYIDGDQVLSIKFGRTKEALERPRPLSCATALQLPGD
jgi:hypothetical protein